MWLRLGIRTMVGWAFSHDFEHVLLCYHRKGQFWVQPGGHLEAAEETGLRTIEPITDLPDVIPPAAWRGRLRTVLAAAQHAAAA